MNRKRFALLGLLVTLMSLNAHGSETEYARLVDYYHQLKALEQDLAATKLVQGPEGDQGDRGPQGAKGPQGIHGRDLTDDEVNQIYGVLDEREIWLREMVIKQDMILQKIDETKEAVSTIEGYLDWLEQNL